jgi:pimeloyl-ACP methyl ester carboxylesterase
MNAWSSGDVVVDDVRLRYHRTGGDKPPLLIAHGVTDNGLAWSHFARALAPEYDVVMYDRRGHGFSDAPESGYTFEDHAKDMGGLISALDLGRPHIVAHSGGAAAATILAANHPDLLSSLVLEDPAWGSAWGGWEATVAGITEWFLGIVSLTRPELVALGHETYPNWSEEEIALWADSKVQVSPHVVQTFDQPEPAWRAFVGQLACPILLVVGDPEAGTINTPDDVAAIESVWQNGRVISFKGAGHVIHYDRREAFVAAVKAFLAEVTSN